MKRNILKAFVMTILGAVTIVGVTSCKDKNSNNNDPEIIEPDPDPVEPDAPVTPDLNQITGITLSDSAITYDGEAHTIMYEGTLPDGVSSTFSITNQQQSVVTEAKEVGVYTFSYTFSGDGYETLTLNALLTINAKEFEGLTLTSKTVKYTGANQTIEVAGDIPTDASVEYTYKDSSNNTVTECVLPGTYSVIAKITGPNFKSLELNANLVIEKVQATDVVIDKQTALYAGNKIAYDLTALKQTYNVELDGYYEDSNLKTAIDLEKVKSGEYKVKDGLYYVKLRISNDIYEETVKVCELEIIKNENSYHDVLFTFTYEDKNYEKEYVASPNEVLSDSLIATITAGWQTPDDGYEYVYNGSYKYTPITEDTVIPMNWERFTYEVQFVDSNGNKLADSVEGIINYDDVVFPYVTIGDKIVATWSCGNVEVLSGDGAKLDAESLAVDRVITFTPSAIIEYDPLTDYEFRNYYDGVTAGYLITSYSGTDNTLELPEFIVDKTVQRVYRILGADSNAFADNYTIHALIIPSSYTSIQEYAFGYMKQLYSVVIPSNHIVDNDLIIFEGSYTIAEYMYYGDNNPISNEYTFGDLASIASLGHSYSSGSIIVKDGDYVYYTYNNETYLVQFTNDNLEADIVFPSTLGGNSYTIRNDAIYVPEEYFADDLDNYVRVNITIDNVNISSYAFRNANLKSITLGDNVTIDGVGIFMFAQIEDIYLGTSITELTNNFFNFSIINAIHISGIITSIAENAFKSTYEFNQDIRIYFKASESDINPTVADGNAEYNSIEKLYNQTF